jgi:hypothetical protein
MRILYNDFDTGHQFTQLRLKIIDDIYETYGAAVDSIKGTDVTYDHIMDSIIQIYQTDQQLEDRLDSIFR